jgi:hypothetical protein
LWSFLLMQARWNYQKYGWWSWREETSDIEQKMVFCRNPILSRTGLTTFPTYLSSLSPIFATTWSESQTSTKKTWNHSRVFRDTGFSKMDTW